MDKNSIQGLLLMAAVIFLFMWLNKPKQNQNQLNQPGMETVAEQQAQAAAVAVDAKQVAGVVKNYGTADEENGVVRLQNGDVDLFVAANDTIGAVQGTVQVGENKVNVADVMSGGNGGFAPEVADKARALVNDAAMTYIRYKSFAPFFYGSDQTATLENEYLKVDFASKGGLVQAVTLKKYKTGYPESEKEQDVTLFNAETGNYHFSFQTADQHIYTDQLYFQITEKTDTSLVMSLPLANNVYWQLRYTLKPESYIVSMAMEQKSVDQMIPPSTTVMSFDWTQKMRRFETGRTFEERNSSVYYKMLGEGPDDLGSGKAKTEKVNGAVKWIGFKNQFFSSVIIPRKTFSMADMSCTPLKAEDYIKDMSAEATFAYNISEAEPAAFDFYFGPNDYPLLSSLDDKISPDGEDLDLNRLVPLGWGLFRWINQLIVIPVFTFLSKFISNYGIIILLLTIFIKLILFPFTYKSYMSQAKMRVLAPEIKEINEKYPGDENAMKRQQETMALYSRAGASPFSGCLPMLLQMPVLIAMFAFFPSSIELRGESFLWAKDLSAPDYICSLPFKIPFYGDHVSLFCLLMTAVNIIYSHINMQNQPSSSSMPGMKWMMYLMPVMFLFIFNDYASGLSYYYFLSLLITIVQTYVCRKIIDEKKVRAQMLENAKNPKKKKTGFFARLEQMQKQQEAMMRQQAKENARKRR